MQIESGKDAGNTPEKNGSSVALEICGVTKRYPGVTALADVDFKAHRGEVSVLVGENGAGKSTLVKVIIGAQIPDELRLMKINGKEVHISNPKDAMIYGIAAVHQHFSLFNDMTVAENVFIGREPKSNAMFVNDREIKQKTISLLEELGIPLNINQDVGQLSAGDRQIVEICKALSQEPEILLMDEPTAALSKDETKRLFEVIRKLQARGVSIVYISHRLEEVFEIGNTVTVLRNGKSVHSGLISELSHHELSKLIVGKEIKNKYPKMKTQIGNVVLGLNKLRNVHSSVVLEDISFDLCAGEIVGVYGILGSGKDDLARTIAGVSPATEGIIEVKGRRVSLRSPKQAIKHKIGYLTDDRHGNGLILGMTVKQNQTLAGLRRFSYPGHIIASKEREASLKYIKELRIKTPSINSVINQLSGGNQQKVVFSKWLINQAEILILHEPTVGVDVGSKVEVFDLMVQHVKKGGAVLFVSSELEEVAEMSDRILVMCAGRIVNEFKRHEVENDELLRIATQKIDT